MTNAQNEGSGVHSLGQKHRRRRARRRPTRILTLAELKKTLNRLAERSLSQKEFLEGAAKAYALYLWHTSADVEYVKDLSSATKLSTCSVALCTKRSLVSRLVKAEGELVRELRERGVRSTRPNHPRHADLVVVDSGLDVKRYRRVLGTDRVVKSRMFGLGGDVRVRNIAAAIEYWMSCRGWN